jgi:hypothetical protein
MTLPNPLDHHWRESLPFAFGGVGASSAFGWLAHVDWSQVANTAAVVLFALGGTAIALYRQWSLTQIELDMRRRQIRETPVDQLRPDEIAASEKTGGPSK